jgi:hypothetical protein
MLINTIFEIQKLKKHFTGLRQIISFKIKVECFKVICCKVLIY